MKKTRKFLSLLLVAALAATFGLTACREPKEETDQIVVTYDKNLEGTGLSDNEVTTIDDVTLEEGQKLVKRSLTVKSGAANPKSLGFRTWCTDKSGQQEWDFSQGVTKSMTLYAKWEKMLNVNYWVGGQKISSHSVFSGERAEEKTGLEGFRKNLGWFYESTFTTPYDFDEPVYENLDLYLRISEGLYFNPLTLSRFNKSFGDPSLPHEDTTFKLEGEGEDSFLRVHFGQINNTPYIYSGQINEELATAGKRTSDVLTITYKNLGDAANLDFYFVVAYRKPDGTLSYSGAENGAFDTNITLKIDKNMRETDDWKTVSVNLAQATMKDGISEWGTADILCLIRIDSHPGNIPNNDILFKSLEFSAAK